MGVETCGRDHVPADAARARTRALLALTTAVAFALSAGCTRLEGVAAGTVVTCQSSSECPDALVCTRGRCANPSTLDTTPPDLVAGALATAPARVRAGQSFTVTLEVTEPLEVAPTVALGLVPPVELACAARSELVYACSHTATGHEGDDLGGDIGIDVRLRDRAGNDTFRSSVATVAFDFAPPSVTVASVAYTAGPSNALRFVQRATGGTTVHVSVSANERLSATAPATLVARLGGSTIPFQRSAEPLGESDLLFRATLAGHELDGDYALELAWTDAVGNAGTTSVPGAAVRVKTSAPTLVVDQDALVFVRSPLGNAAPEPRGGYTIPAGAYFAVEPSETLTTTTTLPAGALQLAGGAVPAAVLVQSGSDAAALTLGTLSPDPSGRFPRQKLVSPDVLGVWLVGVDDAGNPSPAVKLRDAEWVATPNGAGGVLDTPVLSSTGHVAPTRLQAPGAPPVDEDAAAATDDRVAIARAAGAWRDATWDGVSPGPRSDHAVAFDVARGRLVLFGGRVMGGGVLDLGDTWEWDGARWTKRATEGPRPRADHAMAYDSARGRVVLFGGFVDHPFTEQKTALQDTWEWDGVRWTEVATTGPSARFQHALAYDAERGEVVLFGGRGWLSTVPGDTWAWDGSSWRATSTAGPSARDGHAMAYDEARSRVVLQGGTGRSDTWEWDGSTWTSVDGPGVSGGRLAYDGVRRRLVLVAGPQTWVRNGTSWTLLPITGPAASAGTAVAFDGARGRTVLVGGSSWTGGLSETWELGGMGWSRVAKPGPQARNDAELAYDAVRERVVLSGGGYPDTWEWDGTTWTSVASAGPAANGRLAFDPGRGRVACVSGGLWEWDGTTWTQRSTAAAPSGELAYDPVGSRLMIWDRATTSEWGGTSWVEVATTGPVPSRSGSALATDGVRGRVVLYGGAAGWPYRADTWEWDGASWVEVATTGPGPRAATKMVFDPARGRVVLFGGEGSAGYMGDTWEYDGATWTQVSAAGPDYRVMHGMAHDGARGETVVFGGYGPRLLGDTWLWNPTPEARPALQLDVPARPLGIPAAAITGLTVRAFAGGAFAEGAGGVGATLLGWATRGDGNAPGAWVALDENQQGLGPAAPYLSPGPASLLTWSSSSAREARRFFIERDGLSFQLRPRGGAGSSPDGAAVALDYLEVRVRYAVP